MTLLHIINCILWQDACFVNHINSVMEFNHLVQCNFKIWTTHKICQNVNACESSTFTLMVQVYLLDFHARG